jgi:very-short-patch-repair endonuclease
MRAISPFAKLLRRVMTDAEKRLWSKLRNRQLSSLKFRRQHTIGCFVAHFACIEAMLIIEADGGQHDAGREGDERRMHYLQS